MRSPDREGDPERSGKEMRIPAKKVPLSCCAGILPTSSPGSRDHLDVLWGQSCVSLGMKKGGPGGQSREPAGHQGSDWEELGDALSGYPVPATQWVPRPCPASLVLRGEPTSPPSPALPPPR